MDDLKLGNPEPCYAFSPKCDVFSLGMLAISMCCLEKLDSYYNYHPNELKIDYESLVYRMSRMVYSTDLKRLLAEMVESGHEERIGLVSLH